MRALCIALLLTLTATLANAAPEDSTNTFLLRWLDAQNRRDFAAYSAMYAPTFHGVRRSRLKRVELDHDGWLKDRAHIFKRAMNVKLSDVKIVVGDKAITVDALQTFASGAYHDRGHKRLTLVQGQSDLTITGEELLESVDDEKPGTCQDAQRKVADGNIVVHDCVTGQKPDTFKDGHVRHVTLVYTPAGGPAGGTPMEAVLGDVEDGWELDEEWKIVGMLKDDAGPGYAVVLDHVKGDVAFDWDRLEARAVAPGLRSLWKSDVLVDSSIMSVGDQVVVNAKHVAAEKLVNTVGDKAARKSTLQLHAGKVVEQ